jgi:Flp pilus assembly protein TadG
MFDPTFNVRCRKVCSHAAPSRAALAPRKGAIVPLFLVLLPVLLILCGFAINLAYMQLVSTELKVATDAAAHAGGRAMSLSQTTDAAIEQAMVTAQTNRVGGKVLEIGTEEGGNPDLYVRFGTSARSNNGYGMYEFTEVSKAEVDSGAARATSVAFVSSTNLPLLFRAHGDFTHFTARRRSIATQVDRDIALVLDRSGSMLYYKDEEVLTESINTLYNTWDTWTEDPYTEYGYERWSSWSNEWRWKGWYTLDDASNSWRQTGDSRYVEGQTHTERRISSTERNNALEFLYDRSYSNNVIYQLERLINENHTLGDSYSSSESNKLMTPMAQYTHDWEYEDGAARHSRGLFLDMGVSAFIDGLEINDKDEHF